LEKEKGIRILFAIENGSRAWKMSSKDSDYDVRFIYVQPLDWYLSVEEKKDIIEDKVSRAYAMLEGAHIINSKETLYLLSLVRIGIDLGFVKDIDIKALNELLILMQPAHLQKLEGKQLPTEERDLKRAQLIRQRLGIK